jgi:hypothetical protein
LRLQTWNKRCDRRGALKKVIKWVAFRQHYLHQAVSFNRLVDCAPRVRCSGAQSFVFRTFFEQEETEGAEAIAAAMGHAELLDTNCKYARKNSSECRYLNSCKFSCFLCFLLFKNLETIG